MFASLLYMFPHHICGMITHVYHFACVSPLCFYPLSVCTLSCLYHLCTCFPIKFVSFSELCFPPCLYHDDTCFLIIFCTIFVCVFPSCLSHCCICLYIMFVSFLRVPIMSVQCLYLCSHDALLQLYMLAHHVLFSHFCMCMCTCTVSCTYLCNSSCMDFLICTSYKDRISSAILMF